MLITRLVTSGASTEDAVCDHTQLRLHGEVDVHRQHYHNCKNLWQGGPRLSWPYLADELAGERERTAPCGVFRKRVDAAAHHRSASVVANHDVGH